MVNRAIKNAVIESATITTEERDILTVWLSLDYGGTGQGFGGYTLHLPKSYRHAPEAERVNYAGIFIRAVMDCAGVTRWDDLKGKTIRADADGSRVYRIGHIIKDMWFDPEAEFARVNSITRSAPPEGADAAAGDGEVHPSAVPAAATSGDELDIPKNLDRRGR